MALPQSIAAPARTAEQRTESEMDAVRDHPAKFRAFLLRMPKGADLHTHLSGAVSAESWIRAGAEDHLCVDPERLAFVRPAPPPAGDAPPPQCPRGDVAASQAKTDPVLFKELVDAFSMRDFVPSAGNSGADHFFAAFGRFAGTSPRHTAEWVDEVASRAAAQNEQYLEIMVNAKATRTPALASQLGWDSDFGRFRRRLLAGGLREDVTSAEAFYEDVEKSRRQRERCGTAAAMPACAVEVRYLFQVYRAAPREQVFAQTLLGFEIAAADARVAGINFVQREDAPTPMADYALHMRIVGWLHRLYPRVHIALHAGELAPGMVPARGLCCHIRLAVEQAHAERIGHGVDILHEDRAAGLLREMAKKHVLVEISLSSNQAILGISGAEHPFPAYLHAGVPVALSTDDEGILRTDLTHEYARAVESYGLRYSDLKQMARASLEYSFLPGRSLWRDRHRFERMAGACSRDLAGEERPSARCAALLASSGKARQEWELERRFAQFEAGQ